jgi:hypothetical protein
LIEANLSNPVTPHFVQCDYAVQRHTLPLNDTIISRMSRGYTALGQQREHIR